MRNLIRQSHLKALVREKNGGKMVLINLLLNLGVNIIWMVVVARFVLLYEFHI